MGLRSLRWSSASRRLGRPNRLEAELQRRMAKLQRGLLLHSELQLPGRLGVESFFARVAQAVEPDGVLAWGDGEAGLGPLASVADDGPFGPEQLLPFAGRESESLIARFRQ